MKRFFLLRCAAAALAGAVLAGCGRSDTKVNSDPGPSATSSTESGRPAATGRETSGSSRGTAPGVGKDPAGRPSGPSGGTVSSGAGSGTSGTQTSGTGEAPRQDAARNPGR
jgi:hypothetical protein